MKIPLKKQWIYFYGCLLALGFFLLGTESIHSLPNSSDTIYKVVLDDDTVNPVTAEYIIDAIDRAESDNVQALVIELDTPGGLLSSTRLIVKRMLSSQVPIVVYISPNGSRAGSAGVFITYASHVAAMAPSTNIGAAHPVKMDGGDPTNKRDQIDQFRKLFQELKKDQSQDKMDGREKLDQSDESQKEIEDNGLSAMESKVVHDTVAFIKSIAKERGRNSEWAVESVVQSDSITSGEALEKGVIEIIAVNDNELLQKLHGRSVTVLNETITLNTDQAKIQVIEMDARQNFFNILANPNVAYFLMILGFYGLLFEVTHPGIGAPGIIGAIFLILAFYSMQTLPTNYAGLALMILGLVLLISEAYVPGFGLLMLGGVVCLILGSMLLFESVDPVMRVSKAAIFGFSLTTAAITLFLVQSVIRIQRSKKLGGSEGIVGEEGITRTNITPDKPGKVFVHGELWNARSSEAIKKNEAITVIHIDGLNIIVKKSTKRS